MDQPTSPPCGRCGAAVDPDDWVCAECEASLLVDLVLTSAVTHGRQGLARELYALRRGQVPLDVVERDLALPVPVVARAVTRAAARTLERELRRFGCAMAVREARAPVAPVVPASAPAGPEPAIAEPVAAGPASAAAPADGAAQTPALGTDEEACPRCQAPTSIAASVCPFCRGRLLVDVRLARPIADGRLRYRVARALGALGLRVPGVVELGNALARDPAIAAHGLTRASARKLIAVLAQHEVPAAAVVGSALPGGDRVMRLVKQRPRLSLGLAIVVVVGGTLALFGLWLSRPLSVEAIGRRASASTVTVQAGNCQGSGFFVSETLVLTNAHVLCGDDESVLVIGPGAKRARAAIEKRDEDLDLATVRLREGSGVPLPLGDATSLAIGEQVVIVGTPMGLDQTVHAGRVSRVGRELLGNTYIQIDGNVNHGNSGGPALDSRARVVGIVTLAQVQDAHAIGLALPINYAHARGAFVPGRAAKNWLGIHTAEVRRFDGWVLEASVADKKRVEEFSALRRPALLGARLGWGGLKAVLLRRAPFSTEDLYTFDLRKNGQALCVVNSGNSIQWRSFDEALDRSSPLARWIERNGLGGELFVGEAALSSVDCRGSSFEVGQELRLRDAVEEASSATVEGAERR